MWDDLENFYSGVNSFIDEGNLPIEFKLLGYTPKKFEPIRVNNSLGAKEINYYIFWNGKKCFFL